MAFTIPDNDEATYPNPQSIWMQTDINALIEGLQGRGVYFGCAVTQDDTGASMDVDIAVGHIAYDRAGYTVAAQEATVGAAHATLPRIDLVVVGTDGTVDIVAGTAAANPKAPDIPSSHVLLAMVVVPAAATTIATAQIVDKRIFGRWPIHILAEGDESDADNTLHNDAVFVFPMAANEVWLIETRLLFTSGASSTPDVTITIDMPTGAVISGTQYGIEVAAAATADVWTFASGFQLADPANYGAMGVLSSAVSGTTPVNHTFVVRNGANAGNFQLQWAQNTTTGGTPTVRKTDSYLRATPLTLP